MPARTLAIFNPRAAHGRAARRFGDLQRDLRARLGELEAEVTRGPRDAERIAREAVRSGVERLLVAGGDGTLSEVVEGLLAAGLGRRVELGILPLGSGCDFARGLGLPRDPRAMVELLASGSRCRVDAGRIDYTDPAGRTRTRHFINVASLGLSGLTDEFVNRIDKRLGAALSFGLGALRAIVGYRPPEVAVEVDGELVHQGRIALVAAANGRYFGSGMQIAPQAQVDDGWFDLVLIEATAKLRLMGRMPSLYRGSHLRYDEVHVHRGRRIAVRALSGSALLDIDGEALGHLPLEIEILPAAIGLFGIPSTRALET